MTFLLTERVQRVVRNPLTIKDSGVVSNAKYNLAEPCKLDQEELTSLCKRWELLMEHTVLSKCFSFTFAYSVVLH